MHVTNVVIVVRVQLYKARLPPSLILNVSPGLQT